MHSIARENLQGFLYSYKQTPKEPGLSLIEDGREKEAEKKLRDEHRAIRFLKGVVNRKVAFAVKAHVSYDGSLEDESPYYGKTISFEKNQFLHIYKRYSHDWWLGRVVAPDTTVGFIPTARRLARIAPLTDNSEENPSQPRHSTHHARKHIVTKQPIIYEWPCPYTVVPSTRPIILLGPSGQKSRLTELMHAAVRDEIVKKFGSRIRRLRTDIGCKEFTKTSFDLNENELNVITGLSENLHLVLLETPYINYPADVQNIALAPIIILFRIKNRKILLKLLKKVGLKGGPDVQVADILNSLPEEQVDLIIEENGLPEASRRICRFLEDYWNSLHPAKPLMEEEIMNRLI